MANEKYDPTWSGYMGDYLRGKTGINQLKPQHEFFDAIGRTPPTLLHLMPVLFMTPPA